MKTIVTLALLLALTLDAMAGSPALTVTVYDFNESKGRAGDEGEKIAALITASLAGESNLVVLARVDLDRALREQAFGVSGLVSTEAAARIGQLTGAKVLVAGQVLRSGDSHLVIVANIVGTETGRLFAARVEGGADQLTDLAAGLSRKIADTIAAQGANLVAQPEESHAQRVERIVQSIKGTKRPLVSISICLAGDTSQHSPTAEGEFGAILLKAGFSVVDANSERKPQIEITGVESLSPGPQRRGVFSCAAVLDAKVQGRTTGDILALDHEDSTASDLTPTGAEGAAQIKAVDELAARIIPLLAQ